MMVDTPPGLNNLTKVYDAGSKNSDYIVCVAANLVQSLPVKFGNEANIELLTPYRYQRSSTPA